MITAAFGSPGSAFGEGPWSDEPGRVEWRHAGQPCLLRRNSMGVWCGYVAVPPGHKLHGAHYHDAPVDVHGGLTYAGPCDGAEGEGICHVPQLGEPGEVHWFGFDCGHWQDVSPGFPEMNAGAIVPARYRDLAYATSETEHLAEQLAALA